MDAILRQTGILFLLLALGFLASKLGWLSRETRGGISNILLYIVVPVSEQRGKMACDGR